ncbi:MAG: 30S ribosome-binding factor RbfA [Planctomycetes bacterium]|nr:30S ribosome-binding factor RbfA [Planctomycetota bacterium]
MSHRREQLESTLRKALGQVLAEGLSDPRVRGMISVLSVKVSDDGHTALVNVSVLPEEHQALTVKALQHASRHLHATVSKRVAVRTMPHLQFVLDTSLKKQAAVMEAIHKANEDMTDSGAATDAGTDDANEDASQ